MHIYVQIVRAMRINVEMPAVDDQTSPAYEPPADPIMRQRMRSIIFALAEALPQGTTVLCRDLVGDTGFIRRIDSGLNCTIGRYDLLMGRASHLWPDDKAPWPADIPRHAPIAEMHQSRADRGTKETQGEMAHG